MTETDSYPELFCDRKAFLARVVDKLGMSICDFQETFRIHAISGKVDHHHHAAGVLLPLLFQEPLSGGKKQFMLQLIKRSSLVQQAGDLSFPGGMLHPILDRFLRLILVHGPFPILRGKARSYALHQQVPSFYFITLFLTNALREAWEEILLSPACVRFLGPLPTYSLTLFQRTIFPIVGFVENPGRLRPNCEVEKIIEIPLASFYQEDFFGCYEIDASVQSGSGLLQYPCLIHREPNGVEEILWGATFHIIVKFLEIVTGYRLPNWRKGPAIYRKLHFDYLSGRYRPEWQLSRPSSESG